MADVKKLDFLFKNPTISHWYETEDDTKQKFYLDLIDLLKQRKPKDFKKTADKLLKYFKISIEQVSWLRSYKIFNAAFYYTCRVDILGKCKDKKDQMSLMHVE